MSYLRRLPGGSQAPNPVEVVRDMLSAARAAGSYEAVRAAAVAVYGEDVVAEAER